MEYKEINDKLNRKLKNNVDIKYMELTKIKDDIFICKKIIFVFNDSLHTMIDSEGFEFNSILDILNLIK